MIRVANILRNSSVNGPGVRQVLHVQGCSLACPGCFNPHTHSIGGGEQWDEEALAKELYEPGVGITISGGEPFQQAKSLSVLLNKLRLLGAHSIISYTGYTRKELSRIQYAERCLHFLDALIAGRYNRNLPNYSQLRSSSNQKLHIFSDQHRFEEFDVPLGVEFHLDYDGNIAITGFPDEQLISQYRRDA